jgi:hypothetical protein
MSDLSEEVICDCIMSPEPIPRGTPCSNGTGNERVHALVWIISFLSRTHWRFLRRNAEQLESQDSEIRGHPPNALDDKMLRHDGRNEQSIHWVFTNIIPNALLVRLKV